MEPPQSGDASRWRRRLRLPHPPPQPTRLWVRQRVRWRLRATPTRRPLLLVAGFALLILLGTLALLLPFSARAPGTDPLTALFTATSAVCVTGLIVVDTRDHWSPFGQAVIAALMQLGGLGFVIGVTTIRLLLGQRPNLRDRLILHETGAITRLGGQQAMVVQAVVFTLACEGIGALILWARFAPEFGPGYGLWLAVFHAVAAFTNSGFDLFGGFRSLVDFRGDPFVLLPLAALIICGGLSVVTLVDVGARRGGRRLTLDSKVVLVGTALLLTGGTAIIYLSEVANRASLGTVSPGRQLLGAFFQSTATRTAGFAIWDFAALEQRTLFFMLGLMFIGGAPGGLAGGIKITTAATLIAAVWSTLRGRPETALFARRIPARLVGLAFAVTALALGLIVNVALLISLIEGERLRVPFINLLFEVTSAFATVGLSTGLPPHLTAASKLLLILTMFIGRLGPVTVALVLTEHRREERYRHPSETLRIG